MQVFRLVSFYKKFTRIYRTINVLSIVVVDRFVLTDRVDRTRTSDLLLRFVNLITIHELAAMSFSVIIRRKMRNSLGNAFVFPGERSSITYYDR